MIKKIILALVCLLAPLGLRAQNVVVSGNVKDVGVANATGSNTFVRFTLIGYGPTIPRVITSNVIANPVKDFHPDSSGNIHGLLQGNETITPAGTNYQVCIFYQGTQFRCATYNITGLTFDLPTAVPITSPPPSTQLIYGAKTYLFTQSFPALTWVIPHHFGDKNVIVQCTDFATRPHVLYPDSVALTDNNTVTVIFTTAQSGTCLVMSGGSATFTTTVGDAVIKNPNAAQTLNGQDFNVTGKLNATGGGVLSGGFTVACISNLNSVLVVGGACANYWGGGNLGAQINTAIAALPATGGTIRVLQGAYTVPLGTIVLSKPVKLVGDSRTSTVLNFTGTSGIGILVNYVSTGSGDYRDWSDGIDGLQMLGPGGLNGGAGNAGIGIQIADGSHVPIGVRVDNTLVAGFAIGLNWGNALSWGARIAHSTLIDNSQNFVFNPGSGNGTENVTFEHTVFGHAFDAMVPNSVQITGSAVPEIYFNECSFDGDQVSVSVGAVHFINSHHENPTANTTNPYLVITGGTVSMIGPRFAQDFGSGSVPSAFVSISGGMVSISDWLATSNTTMSTVFAISGSTNVYLAHPLGHAGITNEMTNSSTGNVLTFPNANAQIADSINGISVFATEAKGIDVLRMKVNNGTPYSGADAAIVPSAGFGSTAAVSAAVGYDQGFSFSVTSGGSGISANPTVTITFKDGTWTNPPQFIVSRNDAATPAPTTAYVTWTTTATTLTITFNGTPTSGQVYNFVALAMGN